MRRLLTLSLLLTVLSVPPAMAGPGVRVQYDAGLLRVTLEGSYSGAWYQVYRTTDPEGPFEPRAVQLTLCTGDCYTTDDDVSAGQTYYYRFDLQPPTGGLVSYGPYAVSVPQTPVGVNVWPNPSGARARIDLSVPGNARRDGTVMAEARILDLQGRTVRRLFSGALPRGVTSLAWDGRGDAGQALGSGLYFVRLDTPFGSSTSRLVRFR
jgi:hypothetical protein